MKLKATLYIVLAAVLIACNQSPEDMRMEELTQKRDSLKEVKGDLMAELEEIEKEIAKRDTVEDLTEVTSMVVEPSTFHHFFTVQASLEATKNAQVYPESQGRVINIRRQEGDQLKKGDVIMELDTELIEKNIAEVQTNLELAKDVFERQKRLWEKNIGSKSELERRELAYKNAKNNLEQLQNQIERTSDELNTQLTQAENNYQAALTNADEFVLRSQIDGKVYDILKEKGELVSPQQPLAALGRADEFVLEMRIDEVDISDLEVGQKIILTLDAFPNEVYQAEVSKIFPLKDERSQTFKAQGKLLEKPEKLYPGLAGEANIIVAEKKNSLTIPRSYLLEGKRVISGDDTLDVETGIKSMEKIEIVSGIDSTTVITKPE